MTNAPETFHHRQILLVVEKSDCRFYIALIKAKVQVVSQVSEITNSSYDCQICFVSFYQAVINRKSPSIFITVFHHWAHAIL